MRIRKPVPPAESVETRRAPRVPTSRRPRLLIVNNARPGGQSILKALLAGFKETGLYQSIETYVIPSGSELERVADAARQFDAAVVGVGD